MNQAGTAFDDSGQPVPVEEFDFDALDRDAAGLAAEDERRLRQEVALRLLRLIATGGCSPKQVGQRALLLLYCFQRGDFPDRAALAKRLGVSRARICQFLRPKNLTPKAATERKRRKAFNAVDGFQDLTRGA